MHFEPVGLSGAWLIELEAASDLRGTFTRTFCAREFAGRGLETNFVQHSISHTNRKGTVRGLHFQTGPHAEVKIVSCANGAIYDVILDLRPESETFGQWRGIELSSSNQRRLYLPKGFAHGFQTLTDDADVNYLISSFYEPSAAQGVRYNDPSFGIVWPLPIAMVSESDSGWPDYRS